MSSLAGLTPALCGTRRLLDQTVSTAQAALARVTSRRARRVMILLAGVWVLNLFDLSLTMRAQADGMLYEGNPLARALLTLGAGPLIAAKLLLVAGATLVLFNFRRLRCAEVAACIALLVYVGVAVQWKLCYEMYEVAHSNAQNAEFAHVEAITRLVPIL